MSNSSFSLSPSRDVGAVPLQLRGPNRSRRGRAGPRRSRRSRAGPRRSWRGRVGPCRSRRSWAGPRGLLPPPPSSNGRLARRPGKTVHAPAPRPEDQGRCERHGLLRGGVSGPHPHLLALAVLCHRQGRPSQGAMRPRPPPAAHGRTAREARPASLHLRQPLHVARNAVPSERHRHGLPRRELNAPSAGDGGLLRRSRTVHREPRPPPTPPSGPCRPDPGVHDDLPLFEGRPAPGPLGESPDLRRGQSHQREQQ